MEQVRIEFILYCRAEAFRERLSNSLIPSQKLLQVQRPELGVTSIRLFSSTPCVLDNDGPGRKAPKRLRLAGRSHFCPELFFIIPFQDFLRRQSINRHFEAVIEAVPSMAIEPVLGPSAFRLEHNVQCRVASPNDIGRRGESPAKSRP